MVPPNTDGDIERAIRVKKPKNILFIITKNSFSRLERTPFVEFGSEYKKKIQFKIKKKL